MLSLKPATYNCLHEALRRYEHFEYAHFTKENRRWSLKSLQGAGTGFGYPSEYKQAVEDGFMEPETAIRPRYLGWYRLTENGARVVKHWHTNGYTTLAHNPPMYIDLKLKS